MEFKDYFKVIDYSPLRKTIKDRHYNQTKLGKEIGFSRAVIQQMLRRLRLYDTGVVFNIAKTLNCCISDIVQFKGFEVNYPLVSIPPCKDDKLSYKKFLADIEFSNGESPRKQLYRVEDLDYSENRCNGIRPDIKDLTDRTLSPTVVRAVMNDKPISIVSLYNICKHFKCYPDDVLSVV